MVGMTFENLTDAEEFYRDYAHEGGFFNVQFVKSRIVSPKNGETTPSVTTTKQDEFEGFIGTKIPREVTIHIPNDLKSKGRCKRIKKSKEMCKDRTARTCSSCKQKGNMMHTIIQIIQSHNIVQD